MGHARDVVGLDYQVFGGTDVSCTPHLDGHVLIETPFRCTSTISDAMDKLRS